MESQSSLVLWAVVALVALALALGSAMRWVAKGELLVVTRRGVTTRVRGPGLVSRIPVLEQTATAATEPHDLPVVVRARTRDAAEVRLLLTATVRASSPPPRQPFEQPETVVGRAVEQVVADRVPVHPVQSLPSDLLGELEVLTLDVARRTAHAGAEVLELRVDSVEHLLPVPSALGPADGPH